MAANVVKPFVLVVVMVVSGCPSDDRPPIRPSGGGGGGGGGSVVDAPLIDVDAPADALTGHVCLVTDLRTPTTGCDTIAEEIDVTIGTSTATTDSFGNFVTTGPVPGVARAARADLVTTAFEYAAMPIEIPMIASVDFSTLQSNNLATPQAGRGSIVLEVRRAGAPVVGATASENPQAQFLPFYDGPSITTWDRVATGPAGTIWISGAMTPSTTVTVTPPTGGPMPITVLVEAGVLTYGVITLP